MEVAAIFELPVPVWVMVDSLDSAYPTGFGEFCFDVVMPDGNPPLGGPPDVPGLLPDAELPGEQIVWVQEYGAFIPESLQPATALHRVAINNVVAPLNKHHPSWFTPDAQLAEYVNPWFDRVRTWAEVLTGQDLDPGHRVYDVESVGAGLTFIEPHHDGALGMIITSPRIRPLSARQWADILTFVRDGKEPPLEEVLSRDARAAHRRKAVRRAIIDAATALEISLGRYIRDIADRLPEKQRKRINHRTALGDYVSVAEHSSLELTVPVDRLRWLNDLRNDAAHRGVAPSHGDAGQAVQVMMELLGAYGVYHRIDDSEPDGSEWVVVQTEDV